MKKSVLVLALVVLMIAVTKSLNAQMPNIGLRLKTSLNNGLQFTSKGGQTLEGQVVAHYPFAQAYLGVTYLSNFQGNSLLFSRNNTEDGDGTGMSITSGVNLDLIGLSKTMAKFRFAPEFGAEIEYHYNPSPKKFDHFPFANARVFGFQQARHVVSLGIKSGFHYWFYYRSILLRINYRPAFDIVLGPRNQFDQTNNSILLSSPHKKPWGRATAQFSGYFSFSMMMLIGDPRQRGIWRPSRQRYQSKRFWKRIHPKNWRLFSRPCIRVGNHR